MNINNNYPSDISVKNNLTINNILTTNNRNRDELKIEIEELKNLTHPSTNRMYLLGYTKKLPLEVQRFIECGTSPRRGTDASFNRLVGLVLLEDLDSIVSIIDGLANEIIDQYLVESDARGWTLLHYAALGNKEIYDYLSLLGADENAKTHGCFTPPEIRNTLRGEENPPSLRSLPPEETVKDLIERTGLSEYRDGVNCPSYHLDVLWKKDCRSVRGFNDSDQVIKSINEWKEKPPKLLVDTSQCPSEKNTEMLGLFAGEQIGPWSAITTYGGELDPPIVGSYTTNLDRGNDYVYTLGDINARSVGNLGRMANFGYPNSFFVRPEETGEAVPYLVSNTLINEGEEIVLDYGANYLSLIMDQPAVPLGFDRMEEFFKEGLEPILDGLERVAERQNLLLSRERDSIYFVLNNCSALLYLHCRRLVNAREWILLMCTENCRTTAVWAKEYVICFLRNIALIRRILLLDKAFPEENEQEKVYEWVLGLIGRRSLMEIVQGMQRIIDLKRDDKNLGELFEEVEQELDTYEWRKVENAPLGPSEITNEAFLYYRGLLRSAIPMETRRTVINYLKNPPDFLKGFEREFVEEVYIRLQEDGVI